MCSGRVFIVPTGPASFRVIVFVHGGGWTFGSIDTHDGTMRNLAVESGCAVLGVDYRLAPEHPFPAPLEDVLETIAFVERGGLGADIDASAIAIAGDSAGANLALAAMMPARIGATPLVAAALVLRLLRARFFDTQLREFGRRRLPADHRECSGTGRIFSAARARTPPALRRLRAETCPDCRPSTCRRPASIPCATTRSHCATRLAEAGSLFRCDHFPGIVHGCLRMTRELDAARRMIAAGGRYVAHHFNDKRAGGIQPWNVANSSS